MKAYLKPLAVLAAILAFALWNGAAMTANKHAGIRAALCWTPELASLARHHNDANVLDIPARFVSLYQALEMVDVFLAEPFDGGRHQRRIEKIPVKD